MAKSTFSIDNASIYSFLRPSQRLLIEILASFRTTSIMSLMLGVIQLLFFGQIIFIIMYWHFTRLQTMSNSCGSLSLIDIYPSTIFCFLKISIPGNLLIIPFSGFCIWPVCMIASNLHLLSIKDVKKWPHTPALHLELSHLQSALIIALLRFTNEMEAAELLSCIYTKLPTELLMIIINNIESEALRSRQKLIKEKVCRPFRKIPPMDKKAWLINSTGFTQFTQINLSYIMSEYLVFVHPLLIEGENTWIAVFSRDIALLAGMFFFYTSMLYFRFCNLSNP